MVFETFQFFLCWDGHFDRLNDRGSVTAMNLQLRQTRVKYPFFAIAPQGKIKDKKDTACGRVGTCEDGRKEIRPNKK